MQNQDKWNKFFTKRDRPLTFEDLPNRDLIDLRFFSHVDEDELHEETGQLLPDGHPAPDNQSQQHLKATDMASMAGRTAGDTNSRLGSRQHMKRSESEILNDPDIWNLSDSDDEFELDGKTAEKNSQDDANSKKNSEDDMNDENVEAEE